LSDGYFTSLPEVVTQYNPPEINTDIDHNFQRWILEVTC